MKWSSVTRLILLALALLGGVSFCVLDFGYSEHSMSFEPDGLAVSLGRSGDSRTLEVESGNGERVSVDLMNEWGPDLRTNLYRTADGGLGIIDFGGMWKVFHAPLRLERAVPADEWEYVGTFLRDGYRRAQDTEECMDILLHEPPPPRRSEIYRERC